MGQEFLYRVAFPVMTSILTYLITKYINNREKGQVYKLKEHYLFSRLSIIRDKNIAINLTLKNKVKEKIFKDILIQQIKCIEKEATKLSEKIDANPKSYNNNNLLLSEFNKTIEDIYSKLYVFYKYSDEYSEEDKRTISIVMDKFYKWNDERYENLIEKNTVIVTSVFYNSSQEKTCAFFDNLLTVLSEQLSNAEITFNSINGDLKGLKFKGEEVK